MKPGVQRSAFWTRVARWMPRSLVYFCAVRMWAHATQGEWSGVEAPTVTLVDALDRWCQT